MMKKLVFLCLSFFFLINICNAEVTTYDRNTLDNYGVNKKWIVNDNNLNEVLNTPAVNAEYKIYDFSDILSYNDEKYLKKLIDSFYETTGFDLVILTDSFYNQTDDDNGDYAQNFYDYNDFGLDNEYYSGVVILRNTYPGYPYYGIYSFGEAQFYYSTDYEDDRVNFTLDNVYNYMVNHNYRFAMESIINDLKMYYREGIETDMEDYILDEDGMLVYNPSFHPPIIFALVLSAIITWIVVAININKNKTVYKARLAHDYFDNNSLVFTTKSDILYNSRTTSHVISSSSVSGGGGHSRGSSRGSSGGGRSGGGRRG